MELNLLRPDLNFSPLVPMGVVGFLFALTFIFELFRPEKARPILASWASPLLFAAFFYAVFAPISARPLAMHGMVTDDLISRGASILILLAMALALGSLHRDVEGSGFLNEYTALILGAGLGMMMMASCGHLMMIFLGLELFSLSLYLLCIFFPERKLNQESALKYFILSSLASAIILYGMALVYGATGTTWLDEIAQRVSSNSVLLLVGTSMLAAGLAFKVSAVPFHIWTPDVYQGAPTPVTGFMSVATKTAAILTMFRFFPVTLGLATAAGDRVRVQWMIFLWALALMSMLAGNLMGMVQNDLKRLLAYSSIAHAGYLLSALFLGSSSSCQALLFYLFTYLFANMGAFFVISVLEQDGEVSISSLRGLAGRQPVLAAVLALCLFSLAGLPPTGGFIAKFNLFGALLRESGNSLGRALAVGGILGSFLGSVYYLRCLASMYGGPSQNAQPTRAPVSIAVVLTICVLGILLTGTMAQPAFDWLSGFQNGGFSVTRTALPVPGGLPALPEMTPIPSQP